jgi:hypothetical protein
MKVILLAWRRASIALARSVLSVWRLAGIAFIVPALLLVRLAALTPVTTTDGPHSLDFRGLRTRVTAKKDQKNFILRVTLYGLSLIAYRSQATFGVLKRLQDCFWGI